MTNDIGGRLRRAREQRGLSLRDAAQRTKLTIHVLQAIERNDFSSLPGGMFRKAYVRTLAVEVGLDPDEIAADYSASFEADVEAVLDRPATAQDEWIAQLTPSPRRSIITLAALAVPVVAWLILQPGRVATTPIDDAGGGFIEVRAPEATAIAAVGDRGEIGEPALIAAEHAGAPLSIAIEAIDWCWIAADADGERVVYRLVEPGERVLLEGQRTISLRLGDAGAVVLSINDGVRRSAGSQGEVIELELTPDNVDGLRELRS
jgi:cytoskeleton protein RodZ